APAIFSWALEGLDRLTARGHFLMPASGDDAIRQLEDLSSPIGAFLRARCAIGPVEEITADGLWPLWKLWCESDTRHAGTKATFGRDLKAAVPTLKRSHVRRDGQQVWAYRGIGQRALQCPATSSTGSGHEPAATSATGSKAVYSPRREE